MQHQLAVGEIHTLGIAGGAGGVEGGGDRVLVEVRERIARAGIRQQRLVFAHAVGQRAALVGGVGQQHGLLHRGQLRLDALVERHELAVDQHEAVLRVVHGVEDLVRGKADVDGVQHRADHRDGEHALQVTVAVPVHHRHGIAGLHARLAEHVGQPCDPLVERGVGVAHLVAVDDLAAFLVAAAGQQQALDQQRVLVGVLGGRNDAGLEHSGTPARHVVIVDGHDSRVTAPPDHPTKE
ncbi:hypothetical protein D9M71_370720 [compost metagenome]